MLWRWIDQSNQQAITGFFDETAVTGQIDGPIGIGPEHVVMAGYPGAFFAGAEEGLVEYQLIRYNSGQA